MDVRAGSETFGVVARGGCHRAESGIRLCDIVGAVGKKAGIGTPARETARPRVQTNICKPKTTLTPGESANVAKSTLDARH